MNLLDCPTMTGVRAQTPRIADTARPMDRLFDRTCPPDALTVADAAGRAAAARDMGVEIEAAGRLHLGFLDPAATLGRRYGSIGLVIDDPVVRLRLRPAERDTVLLAPALAADEAALAADGAADVCRLQTWLERLRAASGLRTPVAVELVTRLPAHAGFGSGTQLALALARGFALVHGLAVDTPTLARWVGRGLRSGVGIAGFDQGGLLVDGGPAPDGRPAPLLARLDLPADWRVLVVGDPRLAGLSGQREVQAIGQLPPMPAANAAEICHRVLMQLLPSAAQQDFPSFAEAITVIQARLGAHFAPAQAGSAYTSAAVGRLLEALRAEAGAGIGQSSWGPTGFAFFPDAVQARAALAAVEQAGRLDPALRLDLVGARNHGARWQPAG
ncbi:MAG: beta-ribofuranosylaminobenzene 5-phosphate synthase MptG [Pseudomonadota bacterium]